MNPFPGLRPFRQDEDYLFFGREEQTMELLELLGAHRFVAVVGTSGSGKSSLVRCGLLSELLGGKLLRAGASWEVAVTHPGGNPLALLVEAILDADLYDRATDHSREHLLATLSRSHFGLVEAIKQARLGEHVNFLLVVDQFEEIFRFNDAGQTQQEAAGEFVSLLLEAVAQTQVPIYVVLTMRSDFIGECGQFEGLAEMVTRGEFLIPRLSREQFKRVIEAPIKVAGARITPRLLQRLLNDLGQQADQLPCLQHALMRTWSVWSERVESEAIDLDDYESVGRMSQALSLHADEVFHSLATDRQRELCAGIFKALTIQQSENRGIRRPQRLVSLSQILDVPSGELRPIIDAFRQPGVTFLMPPLDVELTDATIIDVSHESLMRVWTRLRYWVDEEAQAAGIYRRLSESAALHAQGKSGLYRDPELGIAVAWRDATRPNQAWADKYQPGFARAFEFLAASQQAERAEEQARDAVRQRELHQARALAESQRARAEIEKRTARRLRGMVAGLGLVAAVALVSSLVAAVYWRAADIARRGAQLSEQSAMRSAQDARREATRAAAQEAVAKAAGQDAQESLARARDAIDAFLIQVADSQLLSTPGLQPLRADLLESASGFYEGFLQKHPDDKALKASLAEAFFRVGFVNLELSNHDKARAALEKSIELREMARQASSDDTLLEHRLASTWFELSRCRMDGKADYEGAYDAAATAARLWDALVRRHPDNADYKKSLARAYNLLGLCSSHLGKFDLAFLAYQQALRIRLDLLPDHADDVEILHGLGESFNNIGVSVGDANLRLLMFRRSADYNATACRLRPLNVEYATDLGIGYGVMASQLSAMGRPTEALRAFHSGITHLLRFAQANPAVPAVRNLLLSTVGRVRALSIEADQADEYAAIFREVRDGYMRLPQTTGEDYYALARVQSDCARQISRAVEARKNRARTDEEQAEIDGLRRAALQSLRRAAAAGFKDGKRLEQDPLLAEAHTQAEFRELVAQMDASGKEPGEARTRKAAAQQLVRLDQDRLTGLLAFGVVETALNRTEQARQSLDEALRIRKKLSQADAHVEQLHAELEAGQNALAELQWKNGNLTQARVFFQQQIAALEQAAAKKPTDNSLAFSLAAAHRAMGDAFAGVALWDEATAHYAEVLERQPKTGSPSYLEILAPLPLLLKGKHEAYRAQCAKLLTKFAGDPNPEHAARLARVCALVPGIVSDLPELLRIAERGQYGWLNYAYALVLYRAGRFEQAIRVIDQARQQKRDLYGTMQDTYVLAMSHFRLGRHEQAQQLLAEINRQTPESMPAWTRAPYNAWDADWIILRREATELILAGPYSPEERIRRARAYAQLGAFEKSESESRLAIVGSPESPSGRVARALALAQLGRKEQSTQLLQQNRELLAKQKISIAGNTEFWQMYGSTLRLLDRPDEASQAYRRAVAARALVLMRSHHHGAADSFDSLLVELNGDLVQALQAAGRRDEAQAARTELNHLLAAFELPLTSTTAADLLRERPTATEMIAAIDRLLASDARVLAADDPVRLERAARFHHRRAELLEALARADQLVRDELAIAQEAYERVLEIDADRPDVATTLADLLLERGPAVWIDLEPATLSSRSGTTLTLLPDHSVLASGTNPAEETYTIAANSRLSSIAAVRVETLPHTSLPRHGSGRDSNGSFHLSRFGVAFAPAEGSQKDQPIPLKLITALVSFRRSTDEGTPSPLQMAMNNGSDLDWDAWPEVYRRQTAVFEVDPRPENIAGATLSVTLSSSLASGWPSSVGRFRLSVSDDPAIVALEKRVSAIRAMADPWSRLGAAYSVRGAHPRAAHAVALALDRASDDVQRYRLIETIIADASLMNDLLKLRPKDQLLQRAMANQCIEADGNRSARIARDQAHARTFSELVKRHTKEPALLLEAADRDIGAGLTPDALGHLVALSIAEPERPLLTLRVAALQAWFEQDAALAETCARVRTSAAGTAQPRVADQAAKICCLRPTEDKARREAALVLARKAVELGKHDEWFPYYQMALGMALYRNDQFAQAKTVLAAAADAARGNPHVSHTSAFYRAMSLFREGKVAEARALAQKTAASMKRLPEDEKNPLANKANHDDLILWMAYKEARTSIKF
jgi:tetratricopeptide (TPR) repeat protein